MTLGADFCEFGLGYRHMRLRTVSFRRLTTLGLDRRASPQPTAAALEPCRLWQLQHWRDDSTGLRHTIRPLVSCGRLQPTSSHRGLFFERNRSPSEPLSKLTHNAVVEQNPPELWSHQCAHGDYLRIAQRFLSTRVGQSEPARIASVQHLPRESATEASLALHATPRAR